MISVEKCFDWGKNVLSFKDKNGNLFHLAFKGNKTIVCGETATGKSLIYNTLSNRCSDGYAGEKYGL